MGNRLYLTTADMDGMKICELVERTNGLEAELAWYREAEPVPRPLAYQRDGFVIHQIMP